MSTSKWPSWNETLGSELGTILPFDPTNKFGACIDCQEPELINPGFEDDPDSLVGWANVGVVTMEVNTDPDYVREGSQSAFVISPVVPEDGIKSSNIPVITNTTYEYSAWVYVEHPNRVQIRNLSYPRSGNEWFTPPDYTGWFQLKDRFTTSDVSPVRIQIVSYGGPATFWVDEVYIGTSNGNCGYDLETCWNPEANFGTGAFACDADSYFYRYQGEIDLDSEVTNYTLAAKLETTTNWYPNNIGDNYYLDPHLVISTNNVLGCDANIFAGFCGDSIVQEPIEQCEPGNSYYLCSTDILWYTPAGSGPYGCFPAGDPNQCNWYSPLLDSDDECYGLSSSQCCGGYCGDSVLNTAAGGYLLIDDEECELGVGGYGDGTAEDEQYSCSGSCQDVGGWCGDGSIQTGYGEECDGSTSGWDCLASLVNPTCNTCEVECSEGNPYQGTCGNNTREAIEICDGTDNGYPNSTCIEYCSDVECVGSWQACDGNRLDYNGCETDTDNDPNNCGTCLNNCPGPVGGNGYAECESGGCTIVCDPGYDLVGDECVLVAICGNDIIEGGEVCDDGANNGNFGYCNATCDGIEGLGDALFYDNFEDWNFTTSNWEEGYNYNGPGGGEIWSRSLPGGGINYKLKSEINNVAPNFPRDFRVTNANANNLLNVDILVMIDFSYSADDDAVLFARHNGQNHYMDQEYYALWNDHNSEIQIIRVVPDGYHDEDLASTFPLTSGIYWLQFKVFDVGGNIRLQARWWPEGTEMPAAWNFDIIDSSENKITTSGQVGVAGWMNSTFYFDNFQVYDADVVAEPVPDEPAYISAVATSPTSINIQWEDVSADYYQLVGKAGSCSGDFDPVDSDIITNEYDHTSGLFPETTYCYRVRSCNSLDQCSGFTMPGDQATTPAMPLDPPNNLIGNWVDYDNFTGTWDEVDGADHYVARIQNKRNTNWGPWEALIETFYTNAQWSEGSGIYGNTNTVKFQVKACDINDVCSAYIESDQYSR